VLKLDLPQKPAIYDLTTGRHSVDVDVDPAVDLPEIQQIGCQHFLRAVPQEGESLDSAKYQALGSLSNSTGLP
jgi:hypothetical protein